MKLTSIPPAIFLLTLAMLALLPGGAAAQIGAPPRAAAVTTLDRRALAEYRAITHRAKQVAPASLNAADFARVDRELAESRKELTAWAARHGVRLVEKSVVHPLPPEASRKHTIGKKAVDGQVTCDQDMIIDGTTCMLSGLEYDQRTGTYHCIYTCADLDHPSDGSLREQEPRS